MRPARRGFTLVELMVAIAMIAVLAAIAVPLFGAMFQRQRLNEAARGAVSMLRRARSLAIARGPFQVAGSALTARTAGVRLESDRQLVLFVDADEDRSNANHLELERLDLLAVDPSGTLRFASPSAGSEIRFAQDGSTRHVVVEIEERGGQRVRRLQVQAAGVIRLD